ncbi:MAG TPA: hypothetical protein VG318_16680 [Actinomycetota bacterium]|nr:hypothetical protein [Actinomycetota bacterium]
MHDHDEHLPAAIKAAGESFEPPVPDVHGIARRGRARAWGGRLAVAASVVLVAAGAVTVVREATPARVTTRPAAGPSLSWTPIAESPLAPRSTPASAWTGRELIVWGGTPSGGDGSLLDGASYDVTAGEWTKLPRSPLRTSLGRTAIWTGTEMILWGGEVGDGSHDAPDTGAAYDPATRKWRRLPQAPYWSLASHVAVWTGTEMIVWGGVTPDADAAAAYDPATNRWRSLPAGPMGGRHGAAGVWADDRLIVWGGRSEDRSALEGPEAAAYDPAAGAWTAISDSPLGNVDVVVTAWTGTEMIVAGGFSKTEVPRGGAAYDPAAGTWREIADVPVAAGRDGAPIPLTDLHTTGRWTGEHAVFVTPDGVVGYSPEDDEWTTFDAPEAAHVAGATTAWTGDALIVWGGRTWESPESLRGGWVARY